MSTNQEVDQVAIFGELQLICYIFALIAFTLKYIIGYNIKQQKSWSIKDKLWNVINPQFSVQTIPVLAMPF